MKKGAVEWIILTTTLLLIIFDIYVAFDNVDGNTISEIIAVASISYPALPLVWGALTSHFLFTRDWRKYIESKKLYYIRSNRNLILLALIPVILFLTIMNIDFGAPTWIYLAIGMGIGYELWPQFNHQTI